MAKKRAGRNEGPYGKLGDFAEDLGRVLGSARNKAESWMSQRTTIAEQLAKVRDTADKLLRDLTGRAANRAVAIGNARRTRRGRPPGSKNKTAAKKRGRTFTAAQRKAQGERMRAYWAGRKAKADKKTGRKTARRG
jgi:hypothetical protein